MHEKRNWVGFFLLGAINNLPYVIVNSAASSIADSFGVRNFVGLIFGANVSLSIFVKSLNTFLLLNVPYKIRFLINGCLMLLGLFGVAYAFSFGFAIACIVVVGSSAAFGENVSLGYLHKFNSKLVSAWGSGTGMAGLLGSGLFIIFGCTVGSGSTTNDQLRHLNKMAFLLTTPVVMIYLFAYFVVIRESGHPSEFLTPVSIHVQHAQVEDSENEPLLAGHIPDSGRRKSLKRVEETKFHRYLRCLKLVLWLSSNLCTVYLFEYVARACAAKARPPSEYNHGCPELYAALQLCYQAGVFVSRSSVQLVQIKRVDILSLLQFVNMGVWIADVHYKFIPVHLLPALMVYVGLLGGASYVNIFYLILHHDKFPNKDREVCVNLAALFVTIGIALGTGVETALFTTILKKD